MFKKRAFIVGLATMLLFMITALLVHSYNTTIRIKFKDAANQELTSVALLKSNEISKWYFDELMDAVTISNNRILNERVENWIDKNTDANRLKIQEVFTNLILEHGYNEIFLLSVEGDLIVSGKGSKLDNVERQVALGSVRQKSVSSTDLYLSEVDRKIYIDFASTVLNTVGDPLYVVLFKIDPEGYLFPFIQNWPLPSNTAETLILRTSGDSIVFLNELRHVSGTALNLKIPISRYDVPAIYAATGNDGIFEGIDYRGEKVISYVTRIPDTPWYMVAKVDQQELYGGIRQQTVGFVIILILIDLLVLLAVGLVYTFIQRNVFKSLWLSQEEYKTTLYSIGDAVITTDNKGVVKNLNPVAEKLTGWSEFDATGKSIEEVFHIVNEESLNKVENPVSKVMSEGGIVGLANHTLLVSKEGKKIPIADSGAPIFGKDGAISGVVLVFRNQSKERTYQKMIEEQRRQFITLFSNLPGMAYRCNNDKDWTMEFVSNGCYDLTGYTDTEIIYNKVIAYGNLIVPDDREQVWSIIQKAIKDRVSFEMEYQIKTKTGYTKWVWEKGIGIYNKTGICIEIEGFVNDIDERKKIESALKESEQLFQNLTKNATVGIFKTDKFGATTYVNPEWLAITGLLFKEAIGDGWLKYVHPDDVVKLKADWNSNVVENKRSDAEYRFVKTNGEIVWVNGQAVPEYNDQNELVGYIGTINNVTKTKEAEFKLKNSNLLLRTVIDNVPDAIYLKDNEGRKLIANKADLINIEVENEEDVIGKSDFDLFPKEIAEKFWDIEKKVLNEGISILNKEEVLSNVKNHEKWISTSKIPYRDSEGKIIGLIGIGHNITRQKKDEEEKMKLLTAVTQSPVSIIVTDHNGAIQYVNPKFTEVTGYTSEEVMGKNPRILKSGNQSSELYQQMWSAISVGREWKGEFQNKKKNGDLFWENIIIAPIRNENDMITSFVAIKEDISDKKKLMTELIRAKEKAEESDHLKTSFLANMSHEIRTPLNSILGFTSLLNDSENLSASESEEYSGIINKSGNSLLQIINDIIDISSLETGQLKIVVSRFQINKVISNIFKEFEKKINTLDHPNLQIQQLVVDTDLILESDINRINQIFINLITNALKFTEKGIIEFGIEKYDTHNIYFKVEDTGIGIRNELQEIIFERFRQGEENTVRIYGGNGLGLSIVRNLVELMGGKIWVESEVGKGSCFRFCLPLKIEQV